MHLVLGDWISTEFAFNFVIYIFIGLWVSDISILLLGYIWVAKFRIIFFP